MILVRHSHALQEGVQQCLPPRLLGQVVGATAQMQQQTQQTLGANAELLPEQWVVHVVALLNCSPDTVLDARMATQTREDHRPLCL
eukprot:7532214-Alexandrium_andersonii.AAC.1